MVARIVPGVRGIWGGVPIGPTLIPNGKKFKDFKAFEDFVTSHWKGLDGKQLKTTPEIQMPTGGHFTIGNTGTRGVREWIDGFNKDSPFTATKTADGIKLTAKRVGMSRYPPKDLLTLKSGPLYPNAPANHRFEFKVQDGFRIMMG